MDLKRKTSGNNFHFLVFERETEEESVLTIAKLLKLSGHRVSVFISVRILNLIGQDLDIIGAEIKILPENLEDSLDITRYFIKRNPVDLIFFTRYNASRHKEHKLFKSFIKENKICTLIDSYERWLSPLPPIEFNGWKIIKRGRILSWFYCRLMLDYFSCYFVSDPHVNSNNPLKLLIQQKTNKQVLDFPFKVMEKVYKPLIENKVPHFIIPGSVDKNRRDYFLILKILSSKDIIFKDWRLTLLGRPIGKYGKRVIEYCKQINMESGQEKIIFFEYYITKELFDRYMLLADYIIAPIYPNKYKYGKDSGALYDIFKYNKFGIINREYFYDKNLPEIHCLFTYSTRNELSELMASIINMSLDLNNVNSNLDTINTLFKKENYLNSLRNKITEIISNY